MPPLTLVYYFKRKYSLIEHNLILDALTRKNSPFLYYENVLDISKSGYIEIYVSPEDVRRNTKYISDSIARDANYLSRMVEEGLELISILSRLRVHINNAHLSQKEMCEKLALLKANFLRFGFFIEFVHYIEKSGVRLPEVLIKKVADFNDKRKNFILGYFAYVKQVCRDIARRLGALDTDFSFLDIDEIQELLKERLTLKRAVSLNHSRSKQYILLVRDNAKQKPIATGVKNALESMNLELIRKAKDNLSGIAINKGCANGEALIITQSTNLNKIPLGRIIVVHQTKPDMTPFLRGAKAIVTDEGGVLCHAANVARELGIAGVIGTGNATGRIKNGDYIEVDADRGIVRKLNHKIFPA